MYPGLKRIDRPDEEIMPTGELYIVCFPFFDPPEKDYTYYYLMKNLLLNYQNGILIIENNEQKLIEELKTPSPKSPCYILQTDIDTKKCICT